jgi:hypothetical protein
MIMKRRFTYYFLSCFIWFSLDSCVDNEDISAPPKSALSVDKTSGLVDNTEFTFTVTQVSSQATSLYPYGANEPGFLVTNFANGQAVVKFKYAKPGTFNAVVKTNNHSSDGKVVENKISDPVTVNITSDLSAITAFSFKNSTKTTITETPAKTIVVVVPYGVDVTKLKAIYTASGFSKVTVGGVEQISDSTVNNFSSPKAYVVTANNGTASSTYTVTVNVTPAEHIYTFKSITPKAVSTSAKNKILGVGIDSVAKTIVIYDTLGTPSTQFDSIRFGYQLKSQFAILKYGAKVLKQDSLLNLKAVSKQVVLYPQDTAVVGTAGPQTYTIKTTVAPKFQISFPLNPVVQGKTTDFNIKLNVLKGTTTGSIPTNYTITFPSASVTLVNIKANGVLFTDGAIVNYTKPVTFEITVNDPAVGIYVVTYTATVTVLP